LLETELSSIQAHESVQFNVIDHVFHICNRIGLGCHRVHIGQVVSIFVIMFDLAYPVPYEFQALKHTYFQLYDSPDNTILFQSYDSEFEKLVAGEQILELVIIYSNHE